MVIRHEGKGRWESVPVLSYKEEGSIFKDVTRQVLFDGGPELPCQLRYFEVASADTRRWRDIGTSTSSWFSGGEGMS